MQNRVQALLQDLYQQGMLTNQTRDTQLQPWMTRPRRTTDLINVSTWTGMAPRQHEHHRQDDRRVGIARRINVEQITEQLAVEIVLSTLTPLHDRLGQLDVACDPLAQRHRQFGLCGMRFP